MYHEVFLLFPDELAKVAGMISEPHAVFDSVISHVSESYWLCHIIQKTLQ